MPDAAGALLQPAFTGIAAGVLHAFGRDEVSLCSEAVRFVPEESELETLRRECAECVRLTTGITPTAVDPTGAEVELL